MHMGNAYYPVADDVAAQLAPVTDVLTQSECCIWIEALRSGRYMQGRSALVRYTSDGMDAMYCCLGVLQKAVPCDKISMSSMFLQAKFNAVDNEDWSILALRLPQMWQEKLADMNDNGCGFDEIAEYITDTFLPHLPE